MLNYETILSSYDDKLTLMQWLKKVEAALKDASAVDFKVNKKGDATLTFSIVFEDGSEIESGEIVLQQGESVASAAIVNGHLILTLTNGDELDAGQLLNGDLNVSGNLAATGKITGAEIVEDMVGYSFTKPTNSTADLITYDYVGVCKNGNKLTFAIAGKLELLDDTDLSGAKVIATFQIPRAIGSKIYPMLGEHVAYNPVMLFKSYTSAVEGIAIFAKFSDPNVGIYLYVPSGLTANTTYYFRSEVTILLSDNLAA